MVPRCLTIATSDSGGGAGIQADLKAFAALGCHGMSAIVALTAQNTTSVTAVHEAPPAFARAQLDAVFDDIGVDAAKTGMLFSARIIEAVADFLGEHDVPLVVDPVMVAASGAKLLEDDAVGVLVEELFPLATVVTPNLHEACALLRIPYSDEADRGALAEAPPRARRAGSDRHGRSRNRGRGLALRRRAPRRHPRRAPRRRWRPTAPAAPTRPAWPRSWPGAKPLEDAARGAAAIASEAVEHGLAGLGAGSGPVDVFHLEALGARGVRAPR